MARGLRNKRNKQLRTIKRKTWGAMEQSRVLAVTQEKWELSRGISGNGSMCNGFSVVALLGSLSSMSGPRDTRSDSSLLPSGGKTLQGLGAALSTAGISAAAVSIKHGDDAVATAAAETKPAITSAEAAAAVAMAAEKTMADPKPPRHIAGNNKRTKNRTEKTRRIAAGSTAGGMAWK